METLKDFQYYLLKKAFSENTEKRDLILEFVDKVLLVEIKKSNKASSLKVKRKIIKAPSLEKTKAPSLEKAKAPSLEKAKASSLEKAKKRVVFKATPSGLEKRPGLEEYKPVITRNRSGNGHKKAKTRKLYDWEKNIIRFEFIKLNGQIHEDACLEIKNRLGKEVSIFQVTGFVTLLHKYVSLGKLSLPDMTSYVIHLKQKHKLWAQYEKNRARRLAA